jgi:hypothetical protein
VNKYIWLIIFCVAAVIRATNSNFAYAFGVSIPWFIAGMILSPIWWRITKKKRVNAWQWFDWLNAGAYIMIGLIIVSVLVKN